MYTILVNDENELYCSHKERIMHRSNCVDTLVFIVDPIYKNTHDMTKASVIMEYVLPVSKRYKTEYLELSQERYNDCFLQYKLPFNTELTSEAGKIELQLTFAYVEMDVNGDMIQRLRKTSSTTIDIISIATWSDFIPEDNVLYESVKTYMELKVRLLFDPPASGTVTESINRAISEIEWRLYSEANYHSL